MADRCANCGATRTMADLVNIIDMGGQDGEVVSTGKINQYWLCWKCFMTAHRLAVREEASNG